ncbi:MAG: pro-sigmaK processing inhibitor BofA family protein [Clostridia bacterium]
MLEIISNKYFIIGGIILFTLALLLLKKGRLWLKSSLFGIVSLLFVNLCAFFTNVTVGVNILTLLTALILGLPGTLLMVALKFI